MAEEIRAADVRVGDTVLLEHITANRRVWVDITAIESDPLTGILEFHGDGIVVSMDAYRVDVWEKTSQLPKVDGLYIGSYSGRPMFYRRIDGEWTASGAEWGRADMTSLIEQGHLLTKLVEEV